MLNNFSLPVTLYWRDFEVFLQDHQTSSVGFTLNLCMSNNFWIDWYERQIGVPTVRHNILNLPLPQGTPGTLPDKSRKQKNYAAALFSEAVQPKYGPMEINSAAWPPLASIVDSPSQKFIMEKDRVPPDRLLPTKMRCRQPWTCRHCKTQNTTTTQQPLTLRVTSTILPCYLLFCKTFSHNFLLNWARYLKTTSKISRMR